MSFILELSINILKVSHSCLVYKIEIPCTYVTASNESERDQKPKVLKVMAFNFFCVIGLLCLPLNVNV